MFRKMICTTLGCTLALLAHAAHANTQLDQSGGVLEVRIILKAPAVLPQSNVQIEFPAITALGVSKRTVTLNRFNPTSGTSGWGEYRATAPVSSTVPFVNHPDQWDNMILKAVAPTTAFVIDELRVTYKTCPIDQTCRVFSFVRTDNTPYPNAWFPSWVRNGKDGFGDDFPLNFNTSDGNRSLSTSSSGWSYSLANDIKRRREATALRVLKTAGAASTYTFSMLPNIVKAMVYDYGQTGSIKTSHGEGGGCSVFQSYYQCNFDSLLDEHFPGGCECDSTGCWAAGGFTPWPYPDGDPAKGFNRWADALDERQLGKVRFSVNQTAQERISFYDIANVVQGDNGRWVPTGNFTAHQGDMFWRMENCWHSGNVIPHAMTLVGPNTIRQDPTPGADGFRIEAAVWDGDFYDFVESNAILNAKVYANKFDTTDADDCIEPSEHDSALYGNYSYGAVNRKFCKYCGADNDPNNDNNCANAAVEVFCPKPSTEDLLSDPSNPNSPRYYFRYDYFVGESFAN